MQPGHMEFGAINISALVGEVAEKFSTLAARNNIDITVRKGTDAMVWANMTAMQQVLSNIIKNAITYTPRGGSVGITTWPGANDQIEIIVRDTGIGIARKDLFRIFEPFYRADPSRSRVQAGSGLGLAIVSELVRLHHGKISVKSAVGTGTAVSVLLPGIPYDAVEARKEPAENLNEISVDYSDRTT